MQLYFIDPVSAPLPCLVILGREESFHCIKVMRMKSGDLIHLTDGTGNLYTGTIAAENVKACTVNLNAVETDHRKKNFKLHIAVAPTKNPARYEWFLEKATEIGIDEITPLICHYSERSNIRLDRMQKVILSAAKQSNKTLLPRLNNVISFEKFIAMKHPPHSFVCYAEEIQPLHLKNAYKKGNDCTILIGPEGDFATEEIDSAISKGFQIVSLGDSRLRTETAAVVATHIINLLND